MGFDIHNMWCLYAARCIDSDMPGSFYFQHSNNIMLRDKKAMDSQCIVFSLPSFGFFSGGTVHENGDSHA